MATIPFTITFRQSDDGTTDGEIEFNGTVITASGRLDAIGASVFATGFTYDGVPNCGVLTVTIECTRTSDSSMQAKVTFSGNCYGEGYSDYYNETITIEKTIKDIPLNP